MTSRQIELVQRSWAAARPIADTVIRLFYRRLFETTPELRGRFCTSMSEQGDSLLAEVEGLVGRLGDEASAAPLSDAETEQVTDAWVWALRAELGRRCLKETAAAWREALAARASEPFHATALGAAAA